MFNKEKDENINTGWFTSSNSQLRAFVPKTFRVVLDLQGTFLALQIAVAWVSLSLEPTRETQTNYSLQP